MEINNQPLFDSKRVPRFVGIIVIILLAIFEIIICAQYVLTAAVWAMVVIITCFVVMDICCVADIFFVKRMKTRVVLYLCDFACLLIVSTLAGSSYLSALYCIILSQFYLNVSDFKSQLVMYIVSTVGYVTTFVIGWVINHTDTTPYQMMVTIFSGAMTGVIIISIHFVLALFLIHYYRTNVRLAEALKAEAKSKAELKAAYEKLSETAVYEERNRIARDIHDNAGHSITAVIMQTEAAKLMIDTNPEEAKNKIIAANIQAKNALEQMRDSVHLLAGRSEVVSLKSEIEGIIAQTIDGTGVKIRSDIQDIALGEEKRRYITNSLKECISNGLRHGGATAFYVELRQEDDCVVFTISDNGNGLPENFKEGFGIKGMREKATSFGGSIHYESDSGDGFEMMLKFPINNPAAKLPVKI
jgi:signal transduction histidine kinase